MSLDHRGYKIQYQASWSIIASIAVIPVAKGLRQRKADTSTITGLIQLAAPEGLIVCPRFLLPARIGKLRLFHQEENRTKLT